ncbi:alpha/beta fold hydrolase [Atopomonas sediminilitoris]|uniref:alpha/beta fold hydrolase n=1 Tax=Atopomonas sediminilitoris TaxID=2919919 RepID=UPI001F4E4574|nr:alpha/beta hydrolase [Atopomonas sediminilitoris]MCJ8170799.1 alpha/beta hydrolase [Atopomonas sediminilitoris]
MLKKIGLTLVLLIVGAGITLYSYPPALLGVAQHYELLRAGLSGDQARSGQINYRFYHGGPADAPVIVMIHGFGANKDNWVRMARHFTQDYQVLAIDLPGFGDSDKPDNVSYDVGSQAERVVKLMDELEVARFHVVGNSMGGHISALIAARHPERILSVGLIDNGGIEAPNKSELFIRLEKGEPNPLVVYKAEDFDQLMDFVFVKRPPLPAPLKQHFADEALANQAMNDKIFTHLRERYIPLEPELPKIKAPTLVLWGDKDRVLDVSSIEVMKPLLAKPTIVVMKDCGHAPMIERPEETAEHYRRFLTANSAD